MNPEPAPGRPSPGRALLDLQSLDLSIDRLRGRRDALEAGGEIRAARVRVDGAEGAVGELRLALDDVEREQTRLENDVDMMRRKRDAERRRMFDGTVANPKELQSIEAEVNSLSHRISAKEDQLLEVMERREELEGRIRPAEAELAEARARFAEIAGDASRELTEVQEALVSRRAEREELAAGLDQDLLSLYEDLRRTKKGVAAARLEDGVCQGCHQKLSAVYLEKLRRTEGIRRCEYCRRILVPS